MLLKNLYHGLFSEPTSHYMQCRSKGNISGGARERRRRDPLGGLGACSPRKC